jgi:hypothetical protein
MFPSPDVVANMLDKSPYYDHMTQRDLISRQHNNQLDNYRDVYKKGIREFTNAEKQIVHNLVAQADKILAPYKKINTIPWQFAKLCCIMEGGFPHTQLNYIFLEQSFFQLGHRSEQDQVTILIHEKIHVYQRMFPLETNILIQKAWKYRPCGILKRHGDARNNPDLNGVVYCMNGASSYMAFNNESPTNLNDCEIKGPDKFEHPFERMAYEISESLALGKNMMAPEATYAWMRHYL